MDRTGHETTHRRLPVRPVLEQVLQAQGFRFTWESPENGVVEKGTRVKALLLGALAIHYKYAVRLEPQGDDGVLVGLGLATSGVSGGGLGMVKVRKKLDELQPLLSQAYQATGALEGSPSA
ncbi:MAG TPA: hypothetical protein VGP70_02575 [Actinomadura sp.]|nr:hypothetical protein [Actinomadura sp.]